MTRREFFRKGREFQQEPLHYTQCGLDEVYLLSGFTRKTTPYGEGVTVSNIEALHRRIGLALIMERKSLSPKELRFLRKELHLTQSELGEMLRLSSQQVARWEKGECQIAGPAELLLRILFALELVPKRKQSAFLDFLMKEFNKVAKQDETRASRLEFTETNAGWINTAATREVVCASASAMAFG